jgi:Xaa-Pro aminopeptidase
MQDRLSRLSEAARAQGFDAVAVIPGASLRYLTGLDFHVSKRLTVAFFPVAGDPVFVLPLLESSRVEVNSLVQMQLFTWSDAEGPREAVQRAAEHLGLAGKRIAAEFVSMRLLEARALEAAAPRLRIDDGTALIADLRMVKDEGEQAAMAEAARIIDIALQASIQQIRAGMTEHQLASVIEREVYSAGGDGVSFGSIVASGPNGANPHHNNSDRPFQAGDLIIIDCGARYGGYLSDITRTVALGEPGDEQRRIYELVRAANEAGRRACRAGASGEQIDAATRAVIVEGGYGDYFIHRTGHGLGLDEHELPNIVAGSTQPLRAGTSFTIEPGIYVGGLCGVRIEDDMVLTEDGARTLTSTPRELLILPAE